jgi:hypothetical protein
MIVLLFNFPLKAGFLIYTSTCMLHIYNVSKSHQMEGSGKFQGDVVERVKEIILWIMAWIQI